MASLRYRSPEVLGHYSNIWVATFGNRFSGTSEINLISKCYQSVLSRAANLKLSRLLLSSVSFACVGVCLTSVPPSENVRQ